MCRAFPALLIPAGHFLGWWEGPAEPCQSTGSNCHCLGAHAKSSSRKSIKRTAMESVGKHEFNFPLFQKSNDFTPSQARPAPQALPGPSLQPQAHLENVEMAEPGWGYQSTVAGKSSSHGAQVTSVHSPGCSAAIDQPWKHSAALAPQHWQQLQLIRCLFVYLLSPQTNMQEVEKPRKGRELLSHFEFL